MSDLKWHMWGNAKHVPLKQRDAWVAEVVANVRAGAPHSSVQTGDMYVRAWRGEFGEIRVMDCKPYRSTVIDDEREGMPT